MSRRTRPTYRKSRLGGNALWVLGLNVGLIAIFYFASANGAFLKPANVTNLLITFSQVLLLVTAQTILLSAGQIDLSQGANVVLSSVMGGIVLIAVAGGTDPGLAVTLPVLLVVGVATGGLVGLANGFLVGFLRINSLIATLGVLGIVLGLAQVVTNGNNLYGVPQSIQSAFGIRNLIGIPLPTLVAAFIVGLVWLQFARGRFGTYSIAIGSSVRAAKRNGIPIGSHLIKLYVVAGAMCGLAGAFDLARFTTTDIGGHASDALASLSGAVIGGTSLFGGQAFLLGSILGAMLALILQSGLVILNFPPFYQTIAIGIVLIIAVAVDRLRRREEEG